MVPLYIDTRRTLPTNITEQSRLNNRPLYQFLPWKQFVSPVETKSFHGGNSGKQPACLIQRYVILVIKIRYLVTLLWLFEYVILVKEKRCDGETSVEICTNYTPYLYKLHTIVVFFTPPFDYFSYFCIVNQTLTLN